MKTMIKITVTVLMFFVATGVITAQQLISTNYKIVQHEIVASGIAPAESVGSNSYALREGIMESAGCTPQESNQYRLMPGMIFPDSSPPSYCTQNLYTIGCSFGDGLNDFILNEIENLNSGCSTNGYGDFTDMVATLEPGQSYILSAASGYSGQRVSVWIDLNDNYEFEETERLITDFFLDFSGTVYSTQLDIPVDANTGLHRLRVRARYFYTCLDPCETYDYGEVEDYMVNVSEAPPVYCTENLYSTGCNSGDGINNFILGDIININSGCSTNGYGDFTELSTDLVIGQNYQVEIGSQYSNQHFSIWIDWNDDYTWDDDERVLTDMVLIQPDQNYIFDLMAPLQAMTGIHRLRVRTNWNDASDDPCATYIYGEAEDYTVNLIEYGAIAGYITSSENGDPIEGALVSAEMAEFETFSGPDGYYLLENLPPGNYTLSVSADGFAPFTSEDVAVVAGSTSFFDIQLLPLLGYCTENLYSYGCGDGDGINNFSLHEIQNLNSGCSTDAYGDFTDMVTGLVVGNTYIVEVSSDYYAQYLSLWIDLDDDFEFEESERLLTNMYLTEPAVFYSSELAIPVDAAIGLHRLRVRTNYDAICTDPCVTYAYGEAEDYTVNILEAVVEEQNIFLPEGWSGISSYLIPENPEMEVVFQDIQDEIVIVQNSDGIYWPGQSVNTLGSWDTYSGYQVKTASDILFTITGCPVSPTALQLVAGWNLMPVLSACQVSANELFAPHLDELVVLKEVAGIGIYWPEYGINTLEDVVPGKAYFALINGNITIVYPDCLKSKEQQTGISVELQNMTSWNKPVKTSLSHLILFPSAVLQKIKISPGDYIGGFTSDGQCTGMVKIGSPAQNHCLMLFGDDQLTPQKDGFTEGEPMMIKLFQTEKNKEVELLVEFDLNFPQQSYFTGHGVSALKAGELAICSVDNAGELAFNIFPNPSNEKVTISWNQEGNQNASILIYNTFGQIVKECNYQVTQPGKQQFIIDVSRLEQTSYFVSIVSGRQTGIKKLIIMN